MQYDQLGRMRRAIVLTFKRHRLLTATASILLAAAVVMLAVVLFKRAHPSMAKRTELPDAVLPAGTLTLITEPDEGMAPVFSLIQNARHSIDIVMYEFKDKDIGDALIAAKKRGVSVRVLVDHGYYGAPDDLNDSAYAYLQANGIPVEWTPPSFALTHQKTLIVDGTKALIMTFNFTPEYYATARDFGVLDTDSADVSAIENTFDGDWKNTGVPAELGTDLVWSPGSKSDMLLIISKAQKTIDIYNEEMQDPTIIEALGKAAARGVAVRVVMTYETADKPAFTQLENSGVQVKTFGGGKHTLYIHAKAIIIDGNEAFLGSENFSASSLEKNRELGLFISDPSILSSLEATFGKDFAAARIFEVK